jgi:broad specificity phosphatase PhoE
MKHSRAPAHVGGPKIAMIAATVKKTLFLETRDMKISQTGSRVLAALLRLLKSTKGVLVVAHGMLWRQSFNYETPFPAASIANSFNYLPANNNIAVRVAGDYPRT